MKILTTIHGLLVQKAYAQSLGGKLETEISDLTGEVDSAGALVNWIIDFAIPLGVVSVFVLIVYGGYMLISSQGNPDKLQEARGIITNAIIGFVFVLLSVAILSLITGTLGINIRGN